MRTIETKATVTDDGKLIVQAPPDIPPGEHHVVVVIDEQPVASEHHAPLTFAAYPVGLVSNRRGTACRGTARCAPTPYAYTLHVPLCRILISTLNDGKPIQS